MDPKGIIINKRKYIRPVVTKVSLDTSLVLMQPSLPTNHHGHTAGSKGNDGLNEPSFQSPFGDKPFS